MLKRAEELFDARLITVDFNLACLNGGYKSLFGAKHFRPARVTQIVTDGEVQIEVLEPDGGSSIELLQQGALFVVPKGKWHQLTASDNVNILYVSPGEEGAERMREHP